MKNILIIIGVVLLTIIVAAGSFWGGVAFQTNQATQVSVGFMSLRGQPDGRQSPGAGQDMNNNEAPNGQMPGLPGSSGIMGQVKTVDGSVVIISTAQDVTTINVSTDTQIEKTEQGTSLDLQPGIRVMVIGQKDTNGNITAQRITIMNSNSPASNVPSSAGMEP